MVLALWARTGPYLDKDLPRKALDDLHSAYWEMHVAAGLLDGGASLVRRAARTPRNSGPDLLSTEPPCWVEVVAVKPGTGPDAVPPLVSGEVRSQPDAQILLRITQAITDKFAKRDSYLRKGWLKPDDAFVIAVNSGLVPSGKSELPLPRIVRAVWPFGDYAAYMRLDNPGITDGYYLHRPLIPKASGKLVATTLFENPGYAGISACLYSTADAFNPVDSFSRSLLLVHNPLATSPLAHGALRDVTAYWRGGNRLRSTQDPDPV